MLCLIPAPAHRWLLRGVHRLRVQWWRIRKPRIEGCRVLAIDAAGRVLLVRHSYVPGVWMPPGGGVREGEDPFAAAVRELREETGCRLVGPQLLDQLPESLHGAGNLVHVVAGRTHDEPRADMREIVEVRFFAPEALPPNLAGSLAPDLPRWLARYRDHSSSG